jgi:NAD(P)-dependent dehydrogenase (short-subunit alcohol dehydrogenase family)
VVVNNAGIVRPQRAIDMDRDAWTEVLDCNLYGPWWVAQTAARHMVAHGTEGSVINIASILGLRVTSGLASYATSKAALIQLTRALALEWARHAIRVNAIAPGYVVTELNREYLQSKAGAEIVKRIPQRRVGEPRDLDGVLLLLASDASRYMTGSTVVVDGGHSHVFD